MKLTPDSPEFKELIGRIKALLQAGDYDISIEIAEERLAGSNAAIESAWLRYYKGVSHFLKGNYIDAGKQFEAQISNRTGSDDEYLKGLSHHMLGYIAFQRSFFDIARLYFGNALKIFVSIDDQKEIANTNKMLGIVAYRTGRYTDADRLLEKSLSYYVKNTYYKGTILTRMALARNHQFLGNLDRTIELLNSALMEATKHGFRREIALCHEFLGEVEYTQDNPEKSLEHLKDALRIADSIAPCGDLAVEILRRMGDSHISFGNLDAARQHLTRAHKLCDRLNDRYELGTVLRAFGNLSAKTGERSLSRSYFEEAITTLRMINEPYELARTYETYAGRCGEWLASAGLEEETRLDLERTGTAYYREAAHLYIELGLKGRARECRRLHEKLSSRIESARTPGEMTEIRFDNSWLVHGSIVTRSKQMLAVVERIEKMAPGMLPIHITGETGTGKELAATLIHRLSGRCDGPFVAVNCAAIADTVFESEFYGHRRGAFTGAALDKAGFFEAASGGTLFLDEISELTTRQQAKLLRVIESGKLYRVGETRERTVDVRLVSVSNIAPEDLLEAGSLRKDFYFRVCPEIITLPPLREKKEDLLPLLSYFISPDGHPVSIEKTALDLLDDYHWPGNIRELLNLARGVALICGLERTIRPEDLPMNIRSVALTELGRIDKKTSAFNYSEDEIKRLILHSIEESAGNRSVAARRLGISRSTLYRKLAEFGIS